MKAYLSEALSCTYLKKVNVQPLKEAEEYVKLIDNFSLFFILNKDAPFLYKENLLHFVNSKEAPVSSDSDPPYCISVVSVHILSRTVFHGFCINVS